MKLLSCQKYLCKLGIQNIFIFESGWMVFEGPEKKVEILVDSSRVESLRELPRAFWQKLVQNCGGAIISEMSREKCLAFILSESSLFVWDNAFLMLTCGKTRLVDSVIYFLKKFGTKEINSLIFQRKNEYYAHLQESTFEDDVKKLKKIIEGTALRFGHIGEHHNCIFHAGKDFCSNKEDITTELLMHHIRGTAAHVLTQKNLSLQVIREFVELEKFLEGFDFDDYLFNPFGYSLNAVKNDRYMSLHITPQEESSYVSFETNLAVRGKYKNILTKLIHIFNPLSFDLINFNTKNTMVEKGFVKANCFQENLGRSYLVNFTHFISTNSSIAKPMRLNY